MPYIKSQKTALSGPINLYYEDTSVGKPVIFIHGWPLNLNMWEYQINESKSSGFSSYRVIVVFLVSPVPKGEYRTNL